ncbi:amidase signature domain-containing protein [Cercophora newfieldiana]|uniref:Amidase signature domain-containing protein n=1 Tax=Cercophora newfieldiana TaxID=92897 RepID=A0AA39Y4T2_9PEZI|nr:amidase signature domain-containing protein [Cercophora newfieldiana]
MPPVRVVEVDQKFYQLGALKYTFDRNYIEQTAVLPAIVLPFVQDGQVNEATLARTVIDFSEKDDVFNRGFVGAVIVQQEGVLKTPKAAETCESISLGKDTLPLIRMATKKRDALPGGPYFLRGSELREAWRLFPDVADAFFAPLQPTPESNDGNRFSLLKVSGIFGPSLAVAVPSRLYFPKTPSKPLNGMRIVVKDNFDVKGIHTVVSNKSFLRFRPEASETAPVVSELLAKGAVLIGKVKMTSFADREYPPSDWIDYHCPFNPRGDGYLVPEGSSSGSAVAVAAYDWLDASFGTDTSASLRAPAAAQGIFGLRTSHGAISAESIIPLVPRFDVVGFMARDIGTMKLLAAELLPKTSPASATTKFPKKLIYNPDWLQCPDLPQVRDMFEGFVAKLEEFLGVSKSTYERIHGPASYDYQSKWAKEYAETFGKAPYLSPAIKNRWPYVKTITPENVAGAWEQVDAYKKWFQSKYLSADPETGSTAIMVDRWTWKLNYRDTLKETPNAGRDYGFGQEFSPSFAELPELVICIGQYEYHSEISQTIEYAPVAVSLIGAKGSDQMLLKLAEGFLNFTGIPATVLTGKTPFPAKEHRLPIDWKL